MIGVAGARIVGIDNTVAVAVRRRAAVVGSGLLRTGIHVIRKTIPVTVRHLRDLIAPCGPKQVNASARQDNCPDDQHDQGNRCHDDDLSVESSSLHKLLLSIPVPIDLNI
jgi:hypothetical protein